MAGIGLVLVLASAAAFLLLAAAPVGAVPRENDDPRNEQRDGNELPVRGAEHQLAREFVSRKLLPDHPPKQAVHLPVPAEAVAASSSPEDRKPGVARKVVTKNAENVSLEDDLFHIDYTPAAIHPPHSHSRNP